MAYDAVGNLIVDVDGRRYSYDEQNRLIKVRPAAPAAPEPDTVSLAAFAVSGIVRATSETIPAAGASMPASLQRPTRRRDSMAASVGGFQS